MLHKEKGEVLFRFGLDLHCGGWSRLCLTGLHKKHARPHVRHRGPIMRLQLTSGNCSSTPGFACHFTSMSWTRPSFKSQRYKPSRSGKTFAINTANLVRRSGGRCSDDTSGLRGEGGPHVPAGRVASSRTNWTASVENWVITWNQLINF